MKNLFFKFSVSLFVIVISFSCNTSDDTLLKEEQKSDSLLKAKNNLLDFKTVGNNQGVVGVFNVPEMLTISKMDSAPFRDISFKVAKAYSVLEEEMNAIGAKMNGMPGMINYNNDTLNYVFECVLPIQELPKKEPKTCKIVVLEACPMLIYNFYGPYQHLFSAYDQIRKHMTKNNLQQNGPMREFYLSDPAVEKDPAKWQTRIMVPVMVSK